MGRYPRRIERESYRTVVIPGGQRIQKIFHERNPYGTQLGPLCHTDQLPVQINQGRLTAAAFYLSFASAAAILISIAASQILLGLALALLLISGVKLRLPRIWLPLGLFLLGTLLSLAFSGEPANGLPQVRKMFVFTVLLVVFSTFRGVRSARRLVLVWGAVGAFVASRGLVQFAAKVQEAAAQGVDFYTFYTPDRITGFMSHWMTFAGQEMVVFLLMLSFLLFAPKPQRVGSWIWVLFTVVIAIAEVLNETRTVWLALGVAGIWLLWQWKKLAAVILPLVLVAAVAVAPGSVHDRFMSVFQPKKNVDSNEFRTVTFWTGVQIIEAHPLLGLGPEGVKKHFLEYVPKNIPRPLPTGWYGHLHNIYLQYAAERGIPTMLMMMWLLLLTIYDFALGLRRLPTGRSNERFLLNGAIAGVIAIMVSGLFEFNLGDSEVLTVFLVTVAMGYLALQKPIATA